MTDINVNLKNHNAPNCCLIRNSFSKQLTIAMQPQKIILSEFWIDDEDLAYVDKKNRKRPAYPMS